MTLTQKKWLKWAVIGFILGTIAVLAYRYFQPKKAAPTYITATAEQADIENSVMATGKVEALNQVDVGAQVSGEVTKLYVEVGQTVKKGDIIAQIDQVTVNTPRCQRDSPAILGEWPRSAYLLETRRFAPVL